MSLYIPHHVLFSTTRHTPTMKIKIRFLHQPGGFYRFCPAQAVRLPIDRCIGDHGASLRRSIYELTKGL